MKKKNVLHRRKIRRANRTRAKLFGTKASPRLAVFRSNKFIYAQLIDDEKHATLASASDKTAKGTKTERATHVGAAIAAVAVKLGITKAVFDRRSYRYHGRVKALAEGARKGGLTI